jgi:hypothetical protein
MRRTSPSPGIAPALNDDGLPRIHRFLARQRMRETKPDGLLAP